MTPQQLKNHLDNAAASRDLISELETVVKELSAAGPPTLDSVEVILRFMEQNGHLDFGTPGPLTHYVEELYGHGYEPKLLESLQRRPTQLTVWMLNRVINGTKGRSERRLLIAALRAASKHSMVDRDTQAEAERFLERLIDARN